MKMCNCTLPSISPLGLRVCETCINNYDFYDCEPIKPFIKSEKKMMLLSKERYDELIEFEAMYKDLCR